MKLNLVYGRSGTGKSTYIYKDISSKMKNNRIFLIVPEQCNLSAEKNLFEVLNINSLINVEVLTLSRMAYRVLNEVGKSRTSISKIGKSMLIFDILSKEKDNLNFLGKSEKNIDVVDRMFTELKKHNISLFDLENLNIDDKYTELKLADITRLYREYEERLSTRFIDENDSLSLLAEKLPSVDMFKDSVIYIDEFLGFTPQEFRVLDKLMDQVKELTVSSPINNFNSNLSKEQDIFYFNRVFLDKVKDLAKEKNSEINEVYLEEVKRFSSEEIKHLEKYLSFTTNTIWNNDVNDIKLFLANNPYTEIEYVAQEIHNLVKKCGYSYKDIGIICEDIDKYSEDAKVIFNKYDIPLFIDEKIDLNQNILIKFIIALLDIFNENWSFESVFNYLKLNLLSIEQEELFLFENYCRKWGIKNSKFYKREFDYEEINDNQEKMEEIRKSFVNPLLDFKNSVSKDKTVNQITKEIYNFIIKQGINEKLDVNLKEYNDIEISNQYNSSYKILLSILDEMCLIFDGEKVTFDKYKDLLQVALNGSQIGIIPATQDQVVLGDTERTRSNNIKISFIIGINDGFFPKANKMEGYLNDKDREILKISGIELAKDSTDSLFEQQFNVYRSLTASKEKLYLSYCSTDKEFQTIRPSILIKKIKRIFPNIVEKSDIISRDYKIANSKVTFEEALNVYKAYLDGENIEKEWESILRYFYNKEKRLFKKAISGMKYTNKTEDISEKNIQKLYGYSMKTSVSRLENYRRCPFSYHLTYGLKLKEKDELKIDTIDTGTFMHEVIDLFFKEVDERGIGLRSIEDDEIKNIVNKIVKTLLDMHKYYIFTCSAKYRLLTKRLKNVVYESICYIVYSLKSSNYKLLGHEIEFSDKSNFKTIKLDFDGKHVEITGKIDRVDTAQIADNNYVRIIDYKSSTKDLDYNQVLSGLQIQLITYMDAICEQTKLKPSGVLYMGLIDNVVKNAKNMSEEEIASKIRNNFRMKGLVLADIEVVKNMDTNLVTGSSDIIPVSIKVDGSLGKSSSLIEESKFIELNKRVKQIIVEISKEILQGKISARPYYYKKKTGCDYCKYKSICMFNSNMKNNEYNYIPNQTFF